MNSDFCVAVHALVYLNHKNSIVSSEELADNICTNSARVRKVMSKLKKANLVETREGTVGGYRFVGNANDVSLDIISDALDTRFVEMNWRSGSHDKACLVASGMSDVMDDIIEDIDESCRKILREKTIAQIDERIFKKEKEWSL